MDYAKEIMQRVLTVKLYSKNETLLTLREHNIICPRCDSQVDENRLRTFSNRYGWYVVWLKCPYCKKVTMLQIVHKRRNYASSI